MAHVLIVDDDGVQRLLNLRLLRRGIKGPHTQELAGTPEEAYARIERGGIDLLVTDYRMPMEGDGTELIARLRAQEYTLPIILYTSDAALETLQEEARSLGAEIIDKTDTEKFVQTAKGLIQKNNMTREEYTLWKSLDITKIELLRSRISANINHTLTCATNNRKDFSRAITRYVQELSELYCRIAAGPLERYQRLQESIGRQKILASGMVAVWKSIEEKIFAETSLDKIAEIQDMQTFVKDLSFELRESEEAGGERYKQYESLKRTVENARLLLDSKKRQQSAAQQTPKVPQAL